MSPGSRTRVRAPRCKALTRACGPTRTRTARDQERINDTTGTGSADSALLAVMPSGGDSALLAPTPVGDLEPGRRRGGHRRQVGRRSRQNRGKGGGTGVSPWKGPTVHTSQPQGPSKRSQAPRLSGGKDLRRVDRRGACASSLDEFGARSAHVQMSLLTGEDVRPRITRAINGQAHWSHDCAPPGPTK